MSALGGRARERGYKTKSALDQTRGPKKKKKNAAKDGESVRQERKERERDWGGGELVGGYQVLFIGG